MKWFNNLKIGVKVVISSAVFILLMNVIFWQGYSALGSVNRGFSDFYQNQFIGIEQSNNLQKAILAFRMNLPLAVRAVEAEDKESFDSIVRDNDIQAALYKNSLAKLKKISLNVEERTLAENFEARAAPAAANRVKFVEALNRGDREAAGRYLDVYIEQTSIILSIADNLNAKMSNAAVRLKEGMDQDMRSSFVFSVVILAIALIFGVFVTFILSRAVTRPAGLVLKFADKLADNDLTGRIDLDQEDELGRLARALNRAADNLDSTVASVIEGGETLLKAVEQISDGNQDLSQRTSEQASALEEIASTVEEATASTQLNADNAVDADSVAKTSSELAEQGGEMLNGVVLTINDIQESSRRIADIISVINDIAFQTNLLALNAAVEAARAGDQGRGFAVVAGEVRNLALRAGDAAKEIGSLIGESVERIEKGTAEVNKSGEALREIIGAIMNVRNSVSEIAASSREQRDGMKQINTAVMEMDTMTQQNASLVEETASASEEMENRARELYEMMMKFRISAKRERLADVKNKYNGKDVNAVVIPESFKGGNGNHGEDDPFPEKGFEQF